MTNIAVAAGFLLTGFTFILVIHSPFYPPVTTKLIFYLAFAFIGMSGYFAGALSWLLRPQHTNFFLKLREQLKSSTLPDDEFVEKIKIKVDGAYKWFEEQFKTIPDTKCEVMLLLPQVKEGAHMDDWYSTERIYLQILRLDRRAEKARIKWVCFVSSSGKFRAFQKFGVFRDQILIRRNARYATLLNQRTELDFEKAVNAEGLLPQSLIDGAEDKRQAVVLDAISVLEMLPIDDSAPKELALRKLLDEKKAQAMVVDCNQKPRGVVTIGKLIEDILLDPAIKYEIINNPSVSNTDRLVQKS